MRFAIEQLLVALYQSRTQFLSGTGLNKLKNWKIQTRSVYLEKRKGIYIEFV